MSSPSDALAPLSVPKAVGVVAMAVLATQGIQLLIAGSFMAVRGVELAEAVASVSAHPLSLATAQLLGFGIVLHLARRRWVGAGVEARVAFGLGALPPAGVLALCVLAGLALQLPLSEIGNAVQEIAPTPLDLQRHRQRLVEPTTLGGAIGVLFAFVIVAPLTEELLFRGVVLPGLAARHGAAVALLLSTLLFAIVHFDPSAFAYALAAGLLLGALRLRTGSLWPCVALHAAVNAVPLLVPRALWPIEGFNVPSAEPTHLAPPLLFGSLALAALALALLVRRL